MTKREELLKYLTMEKVLCDGSDQIVPYFFNIINNYYKSNGLITKDEYKVSTNGIDFIIGIIYGPELIYYISKPIVSNHTQYENLDDILNNKLSEKNTEIRDRLSSIDENIQRLRELGINTDTIKQEVNVYTRKLSK